MSKLIDPAMQTHRLLHKPTLLLTLFTCTCNKVFDATEDAEKRGKWVRAERRSEDQARCKGRWVPDEQAQAWRLALAHHSRCTMHSLHLLQ